MEIQNQAQTLFIIFENSKFIQILGDRRPKLFNSLEYTWNTYEFLKFSSADLFKAIKVSIFVVKIKIQSMYS